MIIAVNGNEANVLKRVGSNQYAFELLKALADFDRKNRYLVYLARPPLNDLPQERKNWQYRIVGPPRLWNIFGFPRALFQQRPRPNLVFNPGHYAPLFSPAPLVVSIMDLGYLHYPEQFTRSISAKLKFWTAFSIKKANHILAISEFTRNDIINTYRINPEKVTATPLGYDQQKFGMKAAVDEINQVRRKYGIRGKYILFLGTLKPNKNLEGLLEAFGQLGASNLELVIAGKKGWLYESIYQKAKDLNLEKRLIFTGFVTEQEVPVLMTGAEVFVMPSFWEGFGIPVLEAMALGTSVVAARVASLPEVVGDAGVLVDPKSARDIAQGIKQALEKKKELAEKGPKRAQEFSWPECARKTLKILEKVGFKN